MISKLTIRPLVSQDIPKLVTVVERIWDFTDEQDITTNHWVANLFLKMCLVTQNYAQVALWDGRVVGVVLADTKGEPRGRAVGRVRVGVAKSMLAISAERRQMLRLLHTMVEMEQQLTRDLHQRGYTGEVVLLAIDPAYQNIGIGSQLLKTVNQYWQQRSVLHYYLIADSAVNDHFYHLMGLLKKRHVQIGSDHKVTAFVYTGQISK